MVRTIINQFLDTDGDGGGTVSANGNYSVTPETFYIEAGDRYTYEIRRLQNVYRCPHVDQGRNFSNTKPGILYGR